MSVVAPRTYNPILNMIEAVQIASSRNIVEATQNARSKAEGRKIGLIEGLCDGIASHVTMARLERYPMVNAVPVIDSLEVQKTVLGELKEVWDKYETRRNEINAQTDLNAQQRAEQRGLALKHYLESVELVIEEWVSIGPQFKAQYEVQRREAIMSGELEPEPSDENWIAERLEQIRSDSEHLDRLLKRAQSKDKA